MMDFLYVANAVDLNSGDLLGCRKVGIALSDVDKRINTLNSTKMPISVELEAGFDFSGLKFNARDAEYMTWKIGVVTKVGRLHINVNDTDLRLMLSTESDIEELNMLTTYEWRQQQDAKRKSLNIIPEDLLSIILLLNSTN